jgi:phosphomannomutase
MTRDTIDCFKAYDVRGRVPDELDAGIARRIGRAYAEFVRPEAVVVGRDVRLSGPELLDALSEGLTATGVDVHDIGFCGTDEIYFATAHYDMDGGIMVTASHNPKDYNGMKMVRSGSRPISMDNGLADIRALAERNAFRDAPQPGKRMALDHSGDYIARLLEMVKTTDLKPLKLVANAGNGCAGPVADALAEHLPFDFHRIQFEPNGHFPNGVPNPMLEENRAITSRAIRESGADMGIAWDGDFDRCFFFDEQGDYVEGYYIAGLLAESALQKNPGERIVHDPRLTWNTLDIVRRAGGEPVQSKSGHAFMKAVMREVDAVYGGEMSAHHYFRDFAYCDSGMLPWLLVAELLSQDSRPLSERVARRRELYPVSGEVNRRLNDVDAALESVEKRFARDAKSVEHVDGLSVEFEQWRFNLRASNTEPVIRLNVEARGDRALMEEKTNNLLDVLAEFAD